MNTKKVLFPILALVLVLGLGIVSADDTSDPLQAGTPSGPDVTGDAATVSDNGLIEEVDPATIPCENLADFEDVSGGAAPGTNYDAILVSGGLELAERFSGQTLTPSGDFDVLSGTPTSPLTLQIGDKNDNVNVIGGYPTGQVVDGLGPLGYPNFDAIGEGSLAVMFPSLQSQFKFFIEGTNAGSATLNFFKADGSSLGNIVIATPTDQMYGFRHTGGIREIAGFSIHNSDPGGIGYDNICYAADPIEVEKDYRFTDVCFEKDNDLDGLFSEDWVDGIDNDGDGAIDEDDVDCPDGTYLGTLLPIDADGDYIVEAVVKNDKVKSYNPGQYYAVSTVNVLDDVETLEITEDWSNCMDISALNPVKGGGSVVIVQVGDDGVAYQIFDAKSDEVTVGGDTATAVLEDVPEDTAILMYVKFGPAQKGELWEGPIEPCENVNSAIAYGFEDSAIAMLELRLKE